MGVKVLRVLIGCEYSGRMREAFRRRGHDAWSCDLLPADDSSPYHYQCDVLTLLQPGRWDLAIFHPSCQYLTSSGLHWNTREDRKEKDRPQKTEAALQFVTDLWRAPIPHVALENPQGCINTRLPFMPVPQYVQPYNFGDDASKKTGLWLRGLPPLTPTKYVEPRWVCCGNVQDVATLFQRGCPHCNGANKAKPRWSNQTNSGQNRLGPSEDRWKIRSETYRGIAEAAAEQWSAHVLQAMA